MPHCSKEMISFFITTKCNLSCIYCYTNKNTPQHRDQFLDFDFAKAGIDDYYHTDYKRHIRFFGAGEPTQDMGLIKQIYHYAKGIDKSTTAEIQTNGCFDEDTAFWLRENIDIIWISCDGLPEIQDHFRPLNGGSKTSPLIEKNINKLKKAGKSMVGIRVTITESNYDKQIDIIKHFNKIGIKNFWVDPIFPSIGETEISNRWAFDINKFTTHFIAAVKYAYAHNMTYGSILTCNFDAPGEISCRALLPVPHLTSDGYVSACDMALFGNDADHMDVFIYGRWDKTTKRIIYDEEKIEYLRSRKYSKIENCSMCSIAPYCCGYCPGEVMNETRDLFGCKTTICSPTRTIYESLTDNEKKYVYSHP